MRIDTGISLLHLHIQLILSGGATGIVIANPPDACQVGAKEALSP